MSSMEIAEIYIDQTFDSLPKLSLTSEPKQEILKRLIKYNETSK